eukprot:748550-Hanusia_phi.AAC.1
MAGSETNRRRGGRGREGGQDSRQSLLCAVLFFGLQIASPSLAEISLSDYSFRPVCLPPHTIEWRRRETTTVSTGDREGARQPPGGGDIFVLDFGKNKGKRLSEVSKEYISWLVKQRVYKNRPALYAALLSMQIFSRTFNTSAVGSERPDSSKEEMDSGRARSFAGARIAPRDDVNGLTNTSCCPVSRPPLAPQPSSAGPTSRVIDEDEGKEQVARRDKANVSDVGAESCEATSSSNTAATEKNLSTAIELAESN